MNPAERFLSPSEAAARLGVSAKALRLYEQRGLLAPARTSAGWRTYGPAEMAHGRKIVAMRALGLSLAQITRVLAGETDGLDPVLSAHQNTLDEQLRTLVGALDKVRGMRAELARGHAPTLGELTDLVAPSATRAVEFALPWPWGGECFELRDIRPLNYIVGPLGSGKTRLAMHLAQTQPDAEFLGLDRAADGAATARARLTADPVLRSRVDQTLAWLIGDGATNSPALTALLVVLASEGPAVLVIDLVEQDLDSSTQQALIAYLRGRGAGARPLFLLTRSSAILDLAAVGRDEAIIFCPANHSPPSLVAPFPGAPGFEALASCLATPEVRARTQGVTAWRGQAA